MTARSHRRDEVTSAFRTLHLTILLILPSACLAQTPAPISDPVSQTLIPTGVSERAVRLDGPLASIFKTDDGTDVLHIVGDFTLRLGDERRATMRDFQHFEVAESADCRGIKECIRRGENSRCPSVAKFDQ